MKKSLTSTLSLLLILFAFPSIKILSQNYSTKEFGPKHDFTQVAPEAATFARSVNYPVSHSTGVPNISIPLYEVNTGGITIPIALSYNAGGFQINEQAPRTGLGWSLSCDLQITRTIYGMDDLYYPSGYIFNSLINLWSSGYSYPSDPENMYKLFTNKLDGMPDKFNYKLLNKSGTFFFRKDGLNTSIVTVPCEDIRINYDTKDGIFIIIDTDGTTYHYGKAGIGTEDYAKNGIEYTDGVRTTWKCVMIQNANQTATINFTYANTQKRLMASHQDKMEVWKTYGRNDDKDVIYGDSSVFREGDEPYRRYSTLPADISSQFYRFSSPKYKIYDYCWTEFRPSYCPLLHMPYIDGNNMVVDKILEDDREGVSLSRYYLYGVYLSKIEYPEGEIIFSGDKILQNITIKELGEKKNIILHQSYQKPLYEYQAKFFNSDFFEGTNYLDSISIGTDRYKFSYISKTCFGNHLRRQDLWGFSNSNNEGNEYLIPGKFSLPAISLWIEKRTPRTPVYYPPYKLSIFSSGGGSNQSQEPDRDFMQRGVLEQIVYPTGGFVVFSYESNQYEHRYNTWNNDYVIMLRDAGGLRIKSISYYDDSSENPSYQKYYRYGVFEDGTGELCYPQEWIQDPVSYTWGHPAFHYSQLIHYCESKIEGIDNIVINDTLTTYLPLSAKSNTYPNGSPVSYSIVTEYEVKTGEAVYKTVYSYTNDFDGRKPMLGPFVAATIPRIRTNWKFGNLTDVKKYKMEENGKYRLVYSKEINSQEAGGDYLRAVYAFPSEVYQVIKGTPPEKPWLLYRFDSGQYGISIGKLLTQSENEKWYEKNQVIEQTTSYTYDGKHYQPSSIITVNSKGEKITRILKYPYDYSKDSALYKEMTDKNMISSVIEERIEKGVDGQSLTTQKLHYRKENGNIVPDRIEKSFYGGAPEREVTFERYDEYGNLLQVKGKDGIVKSYLWGYHSKYPVAQVIGLPYSEVSSFVDEGILWNPSSPAALKTELDKLYSIDEPDVQIQIQTYAYKPMAGLSILTSPQKQASYYDYSPDKRLVSVKDQDQAVLQRYDYRPKMQSDYASSLRSSSSEFPLSVPVPVFETINTGCGSGNMRVYYHYSMADYFRGLTYEQKGEGSSFAERFAPCIDASELVKITFTTTMAGRMENVSIDFYSEYDEQLVATFNMPSYIYNTEYSFYLRGGYYFVVPRYKSSTKYTKNDIKIYYFKSGEEDWKFLKTKVDVLFEKGKEYILEFTDDIYK